MNPHQQADERRQVEAVVRANVSSALIAGLSLALFGFFMFAIPTVKDVFTLGDAIFNYTLRIGGGAMLLAAAACLTGRPAALIFDAVMSVLVGVGLVLSSVLMIYGASGAGINQILYLVFGGMFISAGVRNGRMYRDLSAVSATSARKDTSRTWTDVAPAVPATEGGTSTLTERLREVRRTAHDHPPAAEAVPRARAIEPKLGAPLAMGTQVQVQSRPESAHGASDAGLEQRGAPAEAAPKRPVDDEPTTEGFLASFAKKPPARD